MSRFVCLLFHCILIIFVVHFLSCSSTRGYKPEKKNIPGYYLHTENDIGKGYTFEKGSSNTNLIIIKELDDIYRVEEISLSVFAHEQSFLDRVDKQYPGNIPKKYHLSFLKKDGIAEWDKEHNALKVYNKNVSIKIKEYDKLTSLLKINSLKGELKKNPENIVFRFITDNILWRWIEIQSTEDDKVISWKYILPKGIFSNYAFSIFTDSEGKRRESFIINPDKFKYMKLSNKNLQSGILVFKNKEQKLYLSQTGELFIK